MINARATGRQRFQEPVLHLFRASLLAIMLAWLALITYVPHLSLWWQRS